MFVAQIWRGLRLLALAFREARAMEREAHKRYPTVGA